MNRSEKAIKSDNGFTEMELKLMRFCGRQSTGQIVSQRHHADVLFVSESFIDAVKI